MFAVSRALSRSWNPGDEIVVSEMDHHSHIDTWILSARDRGIMVRHLPVDPKALTLDLSDLDAIVNAKTRLVAVGYASNAVGTINDVARISRRCREVGALLSVDAVHIAPHKAIDMDAVRIQMRRRAPGSSDLTTHRSETDDPLGGVGVGNPAREHVPRPVPDASLTAALGGGVLRLGHAGGWGHQLEAALHSRRDVEGVDARVREGPAQLDVVTESMPFRYVLHGGIAVEDGGNPRPRRRGRRGRVGWESVGVWRASRHSRRCGDW